MVWTILGGIGGIAAVIAVIFALLTYRQQLPNKVIAYQILSNAPLVAINKAVESRVKVLLDNVEVKDMRLLVLKIWNSGKHSVTAEDYFEPISFEVKDTAVISSDILETQPPDLINPQLLKTFLKSTPTSIELPVFPLNPNNSITFSILLSNQGTLSRRGRINEGKIMELTKSTEEDLNSWRGLLLRLSIAVIALAGSATLAWLLLNLNK